MSNVSRKSLFNPFSNSDRLTDSQGEWDWLDNLFTALVWLCSLAVAFTLIWLASIVFQDSQPAITAFGLKFLLSQEWNVGEQIFGGLPYIYGTIVSSLLALIFAIPLGLAVAILTSENFLPY